jgi:hypothetical protein
MEHVKTPVDAGKESWDAPTLVEVDYAQTEAQYGVPGVSEFALYTN